MVISFFESLPTPLQAAVAGCICFLLTSLGAATVFLFKAPNKKVFAYFLACAAGVMMAAAIFGLLIPSMGLAEQSGSNGLIVVSIGFFAGAILMVVVDLLVNKLSSKRLAVTTSGTKRGLLLFTSITLHNAAEGLAIGVAFVSASIEGSGTTVVGALVLALGIAIQNLPEGAGVSLPLYSYGIKKSKAFLAGSTSALVEPIFAVLACLLAAQVLQFMPFLLALSAGAMVGVTLSELIPDSVRESKNLSIIFFSVGFIVMMVLDVTLG